MRTLPAFFATALAMSVAACGHSQQASDKSGPAVVANGIKHMVRPMELSAELAENSVPSVFEQVFCSAMFEANAKQVICADQARAFMSYQRERAIVGSESMSVEEVARSFEAPREVVMNATLAGDRILVIAMVIDAEGTALGRFQASLAKDGADLTERAKELTAQVVGLSK